MTELRKINAIAQTKEPSSASCVRILHMLDSFGDMSCAELADMATGLHYVTVLQYTRELYRAGAAHIARFEADDRGRHIVKIYKIGRAKDAKRVRLTSAQRQARRRERLAAVASPLLQLGAQP
jgi:predicted ArsR family transcriptional regulator